MFSLHSDYKRRHPLTRYLSKRKSSHGSLALPQYSLRDDVQHDGSESEFFPAGWLLEAGNL